MAKQTFTTGQVLTAAQMTSLQQTAMLGGDASVKVASYTLVAADAGTTVAMNSASTTTITVNAGLFAAGDTVFIQNRGAGVCTVTAGTATVASAGSLALPQNDAGILYFTSASAATFYDFIQAGAVSPLTTKGDLYGFSTSDARIPIGANGTILTADSTESLGLKWAAAGGGGLNFISTTTIGSAVPSVTVTDAFSATYTNYRIVVSGDSQSADAVLALTLGNTTSDYRTLGFYQEFGTSTLNGFSNSGAFFYSVYGGANGSAGVIEILKPQLAARTTFTAISSSPTTTGLAAVYNGFLNNTTQYTAFTLTPTTGTLTGGQIRVYGYQNS